MARYLTLSEAATATDKSRVTLRRYLDQGRFPNARRDERDPNGQWLIPTEDLEAAGAHLVDPASLDTGDEAVGLAIRVAVAEAVATERAEALDRLATMAAALQAQAEAIARLLPGDPSCGRC